MRRLLTDEAALEQPLARLALIDQRFEDDVADPRIVQYAGSITAWVSENLGDRTA